MTDVMLFLREFARTRRDTGAIAPSSPLLARALTRYVMPGPGRPRAVLEVGPGTGAVTRHIQPALGPLDTLDLIEPNHRFTGLLRHSYRDDSRIGLLSGLVQDHELGSYDTIVCGLPFANFEARVVEEILGQLLRALNPGGTLSFFAYAGIPPLRRALTSGVTRERTLGTQAVLERTLRRHRFRTETVLWNIPPAHVHHLALAAPALAYSG